MPPSEIARPPIARILDRDRASRAVAEADRAARAAADARLFRGVNRTPSINFTGETR